MGNYFNRLKGVIAAQLFFSLLWTLTNVGLPYINIVLFDNVAYLTIRLIILLSVSYLVLILLNSLFQFIYQSLEWKMSTKFRTYLQQDLFNKILFIPDSSFRKRSEDEYLSVFNNSIRVMDEEYLSPWVDIIRSIIELVFYTCALIIFVDWRVALAIGIASTIAVWIPKLVAKKLSLYRKEQLKQYETYFRMLGELLKGKFLVSLFTFKNITNRHKRYSELAQQKLYRYGRFKTFSNVLSGFSMLFVSFIAFLIVCYLLYQKEISIGAAVATFSYVENFIYPIRYILTDINAIHASKETREELELWLDIKDSYDSSDTDETFKNLSLSNVKISKGEKILFSNLNVSIKKGAKVAVLGENGSGKSTLLKAIVGFNELENGKIFWNDSTQLKNGFPNFLFYDNQDPIIFSATLEENITIFGSYRLKREIEELAQSLLATDSKANLVPENLSGGEKQIISLLRALNSGKDFFILDEPFSALSKELAAFLTKKLAAQKDLTLLMITHDSHGKNLQNFTTLWKVNNQDLQVIDNEGDNLKENAETDLKLSLLSE